MKRPLALLFVLLLAVAGWLAVRWLASGPGVAPPAAPVEVTAPHADDSTPGAPGTAVASEFAGATAAERVAAPVETDAGGAPRPIPEGSLWIDVRVIDAGTRLPVAGAEVRWGTSATWQQLTSLPEAERQPFYGDQESLVRRFGWATRSDGNGLARVAGDVHGATVFATSEGRYGTGFVGGAREKPAEGWVLELEPDRTLRAHVLDALGRPAVGAHVGIRMFGPDGKPQPNRGWIPPQQAKAPDASVEFRHLQTWLRQGGNRRVLEVARWQVAPELPLLEEAAHGAGGVEFDVDQPPRDSVVLRLPPTGRIAARLLHEGQVLTEGVTFQVRRGADPEHLHANFAPRHPVQADGWARVPFVGLGGELVVVAHAGHAEVSKVIAAPLGQDQEVRVELTTEELFVLSGRFLGPDRQPLAEASVQANFDLGIMSGGGSVTTDVEGRFVWLLTKGYRHAAQIERLVFSQVLGNEPPRSVTVAPRELTRGTNDLGVLVLAPEALVVAGRMAFDVPQSSQRVWFQIEALDDRRGRNGEERWSRVESLTQSQEPDGRFEVRGQTRPTRHRLTLPSTEHLPIPPIEFRIGQDDVVVPVVVGNTVAATCLLQEGVPSHLLRGVFVPRFEAPAEPLTGEFREFGIGNRYQAQSWDGQAERCRLRWAGLPSGTYTLQITAVGLTAPLASFDDVVLPLPEGGDPRLVDIDLRGAMQMLEVQLGNVHARVDGRGSGQVLLFTLPQADEQLWQGLPFHEHKVQLPVVPGPVELMVLGGDCRPQRMQLSAEQVAAGKVTVELRPWPTVELLVPGVPELPEGISLHVHCAPPPSPVRDTRRYVAMGSSGGLESFFDARNGSGKVVSGRVSVSIGDGTYRVGAYLRKANGGRPEMLKSITPAEIVGGDGLAPISLQLSGEEIRAALEKLAAAGK